MARRAGGGTSDGFTLTELLFTPRGAMVPTTSGAMVPGPGCQVIP